MTTKPISRPQSVKLHVMLGELGLKVRADKLALVSAIIYRDVTSTTELTRDEARATLDVLTNIAGRWDEQERVTRLLAARGAS